MERNLIYIIFILFSSGVYFFMPPVVDREMIVVLMIVVLVSTIVFFSQKEKIPKLKNQYLKHSTLAVVGLIIVFFQFYMDYLLGNFSLHNTSIWINSEIIIKVLSLSTVGLVCFYLGYRVNKSKKSKQVQVLSKPVKTKFLVILTLIFLMGYFLIANPLYFMGGYGQVSVGQTAAYFDLLFKIVVYSTLIQNSRNLIIQGKTSISFVEFLKKHGLVLNILVVVYLTLVMMSGDRGPIMEFTLAYIGCFLFVTKKKYNLSKVLALLFIGAVFITLLGEIRSMDNSKSFGNKFMTAILEDHERFASESFLPQTQELAYSSQSLQYAMVYVPANHDYMYGRFQFQNMVNIIPFFSNFLPIIFDDHSYRYRGSASFITWNVLGDNPYKGMGTSVMADVYLDFGFLGVIAGMFLFGYFMRYAELVMYTSLLPSFFANAFFVTYLSSAIYIARSSFLSDMKIVIWIWFVLWLNKRFLNK